MSSKHWGLGRWCATLTLIVALLSPGVCRAQPAAPDTGETSALQYFVRAAFFISLAAVVLILVQAARAPSQENSRLRASTEALDRALFQTMQEGSPQRAADDSRSNGSAHRGLRLLAD